MTVIDYAASWGGFASASDIKAHGFAGVMRYISHDPKKDLTAAERDDVRANGMSIGLVFESTANRAAQGREAGAQDAAFANTRADALGYPAECTLWYAVDFDADAAAVQPYFDGIASAGGRTHAPYGSEKVISGVTYPGHGWQTVAWSHGAISSRAGLLQNGFHGSYDTNQVRVADYGQWKAQEADDMTPDQANTLQEIRNIVGNLQDVAHRDIDTLQPMIQQVLDDLKNDPSHGGGAGSIDPATAATAVANELAKRLAS